MKESNVLEMMDFFFLRILQLREEMMSGGGTQKSLRKALGAIELTTTVSLAKVNSDYKELDIATVKAENHYKRSARKNTLKVYIGFCFLIFLLASKVPAHRREHFMERIIQN
ncbi:hypothetical protein REPUB_Repub16aG0091200 [Reevesia pubescens]